jgi:hypothetical protein
MPRPKGSKNKVYKASHINIVSVKLSNELYSWLKTQPNITQYLRGLIEKDMKERGILKEED